MAEDINTPERIEIIERRLLEHRFRNFDGEFGILMKEMLIGISNKLRLPVTFQTTVQLGFPNGGINGDKGLVVPGKNDGVEDELEIFEYAKDLARQLIGDAVDSEDGIDFNSDEGGVNAEVKRLQKERLQEEEEIKKLEAEIERDAEALSKKKDEYKAVKKIRRKVGKEGWGGAFLKSIKLGGEIVGDSRSLKQKKGELKELYSSLEDVYEDLAYFESERQRLVIELSSIVPTEIALHNTKTGRVFWTRFMEWIPRERLLEEAFLIHAHETGHGLAPFKVPGQPVAKRFEMYDGQENFDYAQQFVIDIAMQSLETGVYLNAYHEQLAESYFRHDGTTIRQVFIEETFAILFELFYQDLDDYLLLGFEDAQKAKFESREDLDVEDFRRVISPKGYVKAEGFFKVMIDLLPGDINSVADLRKYRLEIMTEFFPAFVEERTREKPSRKM